MNASSTAVSSPRQPQTDRNQSHAPTAFASEVSPHQSFVARAAGVNQLIDAKASLVMQTARLRAFAEAHPEQSDQCLPLIQELEENVVQLQEQIDRELKGLMFGLQKAPAPSPFMDALPG